MTKSSDNKLRAQLHMGMHKGRVYHLDAGFGGGLIGHRPRLNLRFAIVSSGSPSCHHQPSRTVDRPASSGLGTLFVPAISPLRTALRSLFRSPLFAPGLKSCNVTCFRVHPCSRHRFAETCHGWLYRNSSAELVAGVGAGIGGTEAACSLGSRAPGPRQSTESVGQKETTEGETGSTRAASVW